MTYIHHAGDSSGVVDGAAAILMTSEKYMKVHDMTLRSRIIAASKWAIMHFNAELDCRGSLKSSEKSRS